LKRCARCALPEEACLCALLVPTAARTRVVVLMHFAEHKKPTNTGRLVPMLVEGAEVRLRGLPGDYDPDRDPRRRPAGRGPDAGAARGTRVDMQDLLDPARRLLLLEPDGAPLAEVAAADPRPVTLIVADGTWRQARRTVNREPALAQATRVRLPDGPPGRYRLRDSGAPERLATLEAVARALGVLDGPEVQAHLEAVFDQLVERTLRLRGRPDLLLP
jgi:DTW domain-containing protein YfiP